MARLSQCGIHTQFFLSVYIVVGLTLFATTIKVKHMALSLTNLVVVSVGKDVEVFSQTLHGKKIYLALYLCASLDSAAVKP